MRLLIYWLLAQALAAASASYFHELSMAVLQPPLKLAKDSFFGYSIAYDRQNNKVVVSAPRADLDGQVFSCDVTTKNCFKLDVMPTTSNDSRFDTLNSKQRHVHHFWLGATVKADSKNLLVCAPRHSQNLNVTKKIEKNGKKRHSYAIYGTAGKCYVKDLSSEEPYGFQSLPSIKEDDRVEGATHNENVTDSFGWSIDIAADHSARVGGPAMSAGRMMTYTTPSSTVRTPTVLNGYKTPEKVAFNFGYSIATGNFFSKDEKHVAVGTPYGEIGRGMVLFFDTSYKKYRSTIYDDVGVVGNLFAATLCSAKLEKERTSILIGAPAYFADAHSYHTGMVLIYMPDTGTKMKLKRRIYGDKDKDGGFFGASIANVGDMDKDNLDEIAIAAPYEDDGRGTVYLYSGSVLAGSLGTISWLQKLQSEESINFGLSLSALQIPDNGCNDLAIGAPGNDKVAVYHCIPSVTVRIGAIFPNLQNRTDKSRFEFQSCLNVIYPENPIDIKAKFRVTIRISHPNVTLSDKTKNQKYNETLQRGKTQLCKPIQVLTSEKGDYEQDIQFYITARLLDDPALSKDFDRSKVTVSNHSVLIFKESVRAADCKNESCEPNLSVEVNFNTIEPYLIGSTSEETLQVLIRNGDGDTAYRPCATITVTEGDVTVLSAPPECDRKNATQCTCQRPSPLVSNSLWNISAETAIKLDMTSLTSESRGMSVRVDVFKHCDNKEPPSETRNISIKFKNDTSGVWVEGKTDQGDIVKLTKSDINLFGKIIHHTYTIANTKGTNWKSSPLCKIFLKKNPYIEFNLNTIQVYRDNTLSGKCEHRDPPDDNSIIELTCDIGDLFKDVFVTIVIPFTLPPGKSDGAISETSNITVHTELSLHFDSENEDIGQSVTTTLMLKEVFLVPTWIIVVAVLVGLLLLGLLAFALYECGFLRRKTKQKLEDLKTDVKRKSMILQRRSMRLSDSARAALANRSYRELLDEAEAIEAEEAVVIEEVNEVKEVKEDCQPTASNGHQGGPDANFKNQIEISLKKRLLT